MGLGFLKDRLKEPTHPDEDNKVRDKNEPKAGANILHASIPRALGINKVLTLGFIALCVLILVGAFAFGMSPSREDSKQEDIRNVSGGRNTRNAAVNSMPDNYQDLAHRYNNSAAKGQQEKPVEFKRTAANNYESAQSYAASSGDDANHLRSPVRFNMSAGGNDAGEGGGGSGYGVYGPKNSNYIDGEIQTPLSPYVVQAGSVIPSTLITGINSDLGGVVVGQVRENVYDSITGQYLLIPQGTRLIGECGGGNVGYGQQRISVVWNRLIFPNGDSIDIGGMPATDSAGYPGLRDRVNNHGGKLAKGILLGSIISAGAQIAAGNTGWEHQSTGQMATSAAAQNMMNAASNLVNRNMNVSPTLEIRPGFKFNVFITKDIILEPYGA